MPLEARFADLNFDKVLELQKAEKVKVKVLLQNPQGAVENGQ